MSETRKIAAILCSDVVGCSRLAGTDEDRGGRSLVALILEKWLRRDFKNPRPFALGAALGEGFYRPTPRVRSWTSRTSYTCRYRLADRVPSWLPRRPHLAAAATAA